MIATQSHRGIRGAQPIAALLALLLCAPPTLLAQTSLLPARTTSTKQRSDAAKAYQRGNGLLLQSRFADAETEFLRAITADPADTRYTAALALAREHRVTDLLHQAALKRPLDAQAADILLAEARSLEGDNPRVTQRDFAPAQLHSTVSAAPAVALKPASGRHSFHQRADTRALAAEIARSYGLRAVFDTEFVSKQVRIDLDDADYDTAMRVFALLSDTMSSPLEERTILFASDTENNRQRLERLVEQTYFTAGLTADQVKDLTTIAQTVFGMKQVSVQPELGTMVIRGPVDQITAINTVFADLLQSSTDVVFDIKLYAVDHSRTRNLGITIPTQLSAYSLASEAQRIVNANQALIQQLISSGVIPATATTTELAIYLVLAGASTSSLVTNTFLLLGGGLTTAGLSVGSLSLNAALNQSDARAIDDLQLRSGDNQTAIFKSGVRYPIQTSLFSDIASTSASSLAGINVNGVSLSSLLAGLLGSGRTLGTSAVIPQVQYEDLGLTVTAVPRIQRSRDIATHLEVKLTALAGSALNGIPVLASRQFTSDITVHDAETVMMVSDVSETEINAVSGIPGLSEIPGLRNTTNRNSTKSTGSLVLLVTPHIVGRKHPGITGPYVPLQRRPGDD